MMRLNGRFYLDRRIVLYGGVFVCKDLKWPQSIRRLTQMTYCNHKAVVFERLQLAA
jgi:drug/metabolite transporter superfamily protein YnfA